MAVSIVDGWHGAPDLAARSDPCWQRLTWLVTSAVEQVVLELAQRRGRVVAPLRYGAQGWGVVIAGGARAREHDHGDAHWSAVWYSDPGDPPPVDDPDAGSIRFTDPRRGGSRALALCTVAPAAGAALLFPGWLRHEVLAYRGTRRRVSVSYNVTLTPGT